VQFNNAILSWTKFRCGH